MCNGNRGYYVVDSGTCICCCVACTERAKRADLPCFQISPTEFERHSGGLSCQLAAKEQRVCTSSASTSMHSVIQLEVFGVLSLLSACREGHVVKVSLDVGIWHMQACRPPRSGRPH